MTSGGQMRAAASLNTSRHKLARIEFDNCLLRVIRVEHFIIATTYTEMCFLESGVTSAVALLLPESYAYPPA